MELAVDFECPACRQVFSQRLAEFSPGKDRRCIDCDVPAVLTESGLRELQRRLVEIYPGGCSELGMAI